MKCNICNEETYKVIDLDNYPLTEKLIDSPEDIDRINQSFHFCDNCKYGQMGNVPSKEKLYGDEYDFRTSVSSYGASRNNDELVKLLPRKYYKQIIEIGCNDGNLIKKINSRCDKAYGIDPVVKEGNEGNISFIKDFIENVDLNLKDSLVVSNQVIEHLENPYSFFKNLSEIATDTTDFIFGYPNFNILDEYLRYDQLFTHHLNYYSDTSIREILKRNNFRLIDDSNNKSYWGTKFIHFKLGRMKDKLDESYLNHEYIKKRYNIFNVIMDKTRDYLVRNDNIYAYGANYQFPILDWYLDLYSNIEGIVDDSKPKQGKYLPGFDKEIIGLDNIHHISNSKFIITAINFNRSIIKNLLSKNVNEIYDIFGVI